jgi:type II secretory pathway pseudopilin PulG
MRMHSSHLPNRRRSQQGYILLALLLATTLILIALAAGLPAITAQLRHQREDELIHRGAQYTRAIRKYYRKFGTYPTSLDQLTEANHMHFLRQQYKDPMTGGEFRPLHVGEVQLAFRPVALPGSADSGATGSANQSGAVSGQSGDSSTSPSPLLPPSQMGATGSDFGGGPIFGVASTSEKQSFHVFNNGDHYKDWLFVYTPSIDYCGGLFTRPFDGILPPNNCSLPTVPPYMPTAPGGGGAPGVPVPSPTNPLLGTE